MKRITTKVMTISAQILVVSIFTFILFSGKGSNDKSFTVYNDNYDKMADKTSILFEVEEKNIKEEKKEEEKETPLEDISSSEEKKEEVKEVVVEEAPVVEAPKVVEVNPVSQNTAIETYVGTLTGYGADCYGCSGYTSSGHNLNESMYYNDLEYGTVRILAADKQFPFYSIFRVSNVPGMEPFIGIVLDRGGNVGFGRGTLFDLAYSNESDPNLIHLTNNVTFELLRSGR